MWRKLKSSLSPAKGSDLDKIAKFWSSFQKYHTALCEQGPGSSKVAKALVSSEIQGLEKIIQMLIQEDMTDDFNQRSMGVCMESCLDCSLFEELVAAAQTDFPPGLMNFVLNLIIQVLTGIQNQIILAQSSFHSSITALMHVIAGRLLSGHEFNNSKPLVIKLINELLKQGYQDPVILELFSCKSGDKEEFLPLSVLMLYFQDEYAQEIPELRESFIIASQIENRPLFEMAIKSSELALMLITKLVFYFQTLPVIVDTDEKYMILENQIKELISYTQFLNDIYTGTIHEFLKDDIVHNFYEEFCVSVLTPRLQSMDVNIRCSATFALCIIMQEISNMDLVLPLVYFLQGKGKNGDKRVASLVSTPTYSVEHKIIFPGEQKASNKVENVSHPPQVNIRNQGCKPLADIKKMWQTTLQNLTCDNYLLSFNTLRLIYVLLAKNNWKIVKLMITDHFSGTSPNDEFKIDCETFMSMFPSSVFSFNANTFSDFITSAYSSTFEGSSIIYKNIVNEDSEFTGASASKLNENFSKSPITKSAGTGGTPRKRLQLFIETEEEEPFNPGEILDYAISKFNNFLGNSFQENLMLTGIISALTIYPKVNEATRALNNFLIEPQDKKSNVMFINILKNIASDIDSKLLEDTSLNSKLLMVKEMLEMPLKLGFYDSIIVSRKLTRRKTNENCVNESEKQFLEAVVVFQEFLKEMCSLLLFKELMHDMTASSKELRKLPEFD